jgi:hypothetical protein
MKNLRTGTGRLGIHTYVVLIFTITLACTPFTIVKAQQAFSHGQNIAPVFEGWEQKADGSFDLVFGFFNRNCEEALNIPIGANNNIEPGGPDQGQPTRFFTRRGKFIFKIRVPADFGDNELVWSLTAHGKTEKAYATLHPEYILDKRITMMNEGGFGQRAGESDSLYPDLRIEGDRHRTTTVGASVNLTLTASDDGIPEARREQAGAGSGRTGLMVGWVVYRGNDSHVTFTPEQFNPDFRGRYTGTMCKNKIEVPDWAKEPVPSDGKITVTATFDEPGTYVLRAMAHDGGLKTTREITVTVTS